jgi:hypothetical protein
MGPPLAISYGTVWPFDHIYKANECMDAKASVLKAVKYSKRGKKSGLSFEVIKIQEDVHVDLD